jgi:predicted transcriptional regulator
MKQILLEVDDRLAERLEAIAPARSRKRSEFLRRAIQEAIWALEEEATRDAYVRQPDSGEQPVDARVWDPSGWQAAPARRSRKPRRKR